MDLPGFRQSDPAEVDVLGKKGPLTGLGQRRIVDSKGAEAPDLFRLVEEDGGGISDEAHGEMSDGHLVADGAHFIMGGLFDFAIAKAREIAFDFGAEFEGLLEEGAIAGNLSAGIISDVEIFGAAIRLGLSEAGMMDGATVRELQGDFGRGFDRATELGSLP